MHTNKLDGGRIRNMKLIVGCDTQHLFFDHFMPQLIGIMAK